MGLTVSKLENSIFISAFLEAFFVTKTSLLFEIGINA
jgi:hypothetical protein